jgi:beta-N-acetylhexosaminidase
MIAAKPKPTETTVASESTTTTEPPLPACVAALPIEAKAGQLLVVLVTDPRSIAAQLADGTIGGYSIVGSPASDLAAAMAAVVRPNGIPLLVAGDEEGGTVQRLRTILGEIPSARSLAQSSQPEVAAATFAAYARKLHDMGFNMNLGPSLDIGSGSGLGTRTFGDDAETVAAYGLANIAAVREVGVTPVAKHWPGIGGGTADPHVTASPIAALGELQSRDLIPFRRAIDAGVPAIMVSHAIVPDLSDGLPASLSRKAITDELRGAEHFNGLVITDSLGMGAVKLHADEPHAAVLSIAAGADIALLADAGAAASARQLIVDAVAGGTLSAAQLDRSVARVLAVKGITGPCPT